MGFYNFFLFALCLWIHHRGRSAWDDVHPETKGVCCISRPWIRALHPRVFRQVMWQSTFWRAHPLLQQHWDQGLLLFPLSCLRQCTSRLLFCGRIEAIRFNDLFHFVPRNMNFFAACGLHPKASLLGLALGARSCASPWAAGVDGGSRVLLHQDFRVWGCKLLFLSPCWSIRCCVKPNKPLFSCEAANAVPALSGLSNSMSIGTLLV